MAMKWNSRDYQFDPNDGNSRSSFKEHNKRMREFRLIHPKYWNQEHNQRMRAFGLAHPNNWRQWRHGVPKVQEGLPALVATVPLQRVVPTSRYWQN